MSKARSRKEGFRACFQPVPLAYNFPGKDQKGAIEPFAKAYVLGKTLSAKAKDNLENLWKAEHNGGLDGLDAVIAKAKSDLGMD